MLKKEYSYPSIPLRALMACSRVTFAFIIDWVKLWCYDAFCVTDNQGKIHILKIYDTYRFTRDCNSVII